MVLSRFILFSLNMLASFGSGKWLNYIAAVIDRLGPSFIEKFRNSLSTLYNKPDGHAVKQMIEAQAPFPIGPNTFTMFKEQI